MHGCRSLLYHILLESKALKDNVTLESLSLGDGGVLYFKDLGMCILIPNPFAHLKSRVQ